MAFGQLQIKYRRGASLRRDQPHRNGLCIRCQPGAQGIRRGDGGGKPDALCPRCQYSQARKAKRQLIAAFGAGKGVDFINDDAAKPGKKFGGLWLGQQKREAFRRSQQDMRRGGALSRAAIGRRVTRAGFNANGQRHIANRRHQIARNIHRQGLERRDIKRMQPVTRRRRQIQQRWQKPGQRFPATCGGHQQRVIPNANRCQNIKLMRPRLPAARLEPTGKRFW